MHYETNIKVIGVAAGSATIILWLLGFFAPGLMAAAPTGLEAAITGIIAALVGYIAEPDALNKAPE